MSIAMFNVIIATFVYIYIYIYIYYQHYSYFSWAEAMAEQLGDQERLDAAEARPAPDVCMYVCMYVCIYIYI